MQNKYEKIKQYLSDLKSVAVAFSSGVDSTFLLKTAKEVIGENVIAITAASPAFPKRERNEAIEFCHENNIKHFIVETNELEEFRKNPHNRCHICKKIYLKK